MVDLPRELWDCIAEEIDHADLLNLGRVSRLHAWVCWRLLVRKIVLDHLKKWRQILSLIQKYDLSRNIRDLTICNFSRIRGSAGARELFATLAPSGLRSLAVINTSLYFANAPLNSDDPFVAKMMSASYLLTSMQISSVPSLEDLTESDLPTTGLRNIGRDSRLTGSLTLGFFILLQRSIETVTHLSIIFTDDISHAENYVQLFGLDFPVLISLVLGPGDQSLLGNDETPELSEEQRHIRRGFTQFLARHTRITDLSLDYSAHWIDNEFGARLDNVGINLSASYLRFDLRSLHTNILPNPISLAASPAIIAGLAEGHASLFHRLSSLTFNISNEDDMEGLLDMFAELETFASHTAPFPVPHLTLPLIYSVPDGVEHMGDIFGEWISSSGRIFPFVERLTLSEVSLLRIDVFPRFLNLRELICMHRPGSFRKIYVEHMADRCPSLEMVHFKDPDTTYRITRMAGNSLQVISEADNPEDIQEPEGSDDSDSEEDGGYDV